jgi:HlyD family secretion protein
LPFVGFVKDEHVTTHTIPPALGLLMSLAVAAAGVSCADDGPVDRIRASGHVEATDVQVASEVGGRIVALVVDEGDRVQPNQEVARLDTQDAELARRRAQADLGRARAELDLLLAGSRAEDVRQAAAQVSVAEADLEAFKAELASAEVDLQRFESLLRTNSGSGKQRDDAATRRDVARERVRAGEERVRAARETSVRLRAGARPQEIAAARAHVASAEAQIAVLDEAVADAVVRTSIGGIVTQKLYEVGEIVQPRTTLVVITNLDDAWAEVFIDEPYIPRLRLGQAATVFTDAGGDGIEGKVSYISPRAEFTPRNVQTAEERSKLVYRIKIAVDNRSGVLKDGMPVEAEIPLAR